MFGQLFRSLEETAFSSEDLEHCRSYFSPRKLKRKQYILQEGDVCNRLAFVSSGALFSYSIDSRGVQHVLQFAFEGWWIADLYSFFTREPSEMHIEALEESEVLLIDHAGHHKLLGEIPAYESYTRILYQNAYIALQKRVRSTLGIPAEEKYATLMEQHPNIVNRVPLQLVASYLGVTPETLSRIRRQRMP